MPQYVREAIELALAHPMGAVGVAVLTLCYLNLMFSGPRLH